MHYFDVIVIGSGISGLNFALREAEQGRRVLVVTKKKAAQSGTNFAQGGIAAVLSQLDNYQKHIKDTLVAGCFHNNKKAVSYMVHHGAQCVARLIDFGVPFATHNGKLLLTREGGHSERRIAFVSDYTGQAIEKKLVKSVRKNPLITLYEHTFANELLVKNGACHGIQIFRNGKFQNICGGIIVIATGGLGQVFEKTTNPKISTGDGIAMAYRAGCKFKDLEFVQFHPTALSLKGKSVAIPKFLISEAVRGEGAHLINSKSECFMKRYHRLAELAPRDIVSRAIFEEEKNGPVFLNISHKKADFIKMRFPQIYQNLKKYGLDITKSKIPISPAAHYSCGGIKVDLDGATNIKNLYAFGEAACTGVHGANRLASNSLLEALVFSDRILKQLPRKKSTCQNFKTAKYKPLLPRELREIAELKKELQEVMWKNVGIVRSASGLSQAVERLINLGKRAKAVSSNDPRATELLNMIITSKLIAVAALARKKSLGCHYVVMTSRGS